MKTKAIIVTGLIMMGIGTGYFLARRFKKKEQPETNKEEPKQEPYIPKTPEALLQRLMKRLLEENQWKNERDFLSILSKNYIKEAKDISWIDYLPLNQEDLMETMNEVGVLEDYERGLEERYVRR